MRCILPFAVSWLRQTWSIYTIALYSTARNCGFESPTVRLVSFLGYLKSLNKVRTLVNVYQTMSSIGPYCPISTRGTLYNVCQGVCSVGRYKHVMKWTGLSGMCKPRLVRPLFIIIIDYNLTRL